MEDELLENILREPAAVYVVETTKRATTFINPFTDFGFKRLFASEESKPLLMSMLNSLFIHEKCIVDIEYSKNEYPGEGIDEGSIVFDVHCTDINGSQYIIEIQNSYQRHFKERALFYTSRAISGQAPMGD